MKKVIRLTESDLERVVKKVIEEGGFWNDMFGKPSTKDAAHTHKRKHGWSATGRDDQDYGKDSSTEYIEFEGKKYGPDEIEYADYQDLGNLPRVENGKLIISNPVWDL